jgi:hypothetical protein
MKAWLVSVAILFVLAEFSLWIKNFMLPLPIYILAGAFLAIASNYEKGIIALFRQQVVSTPLVITQTATLVNQVENIQSSNSEPPSLTASTQAMTNDQS